MEGIGMEWKAGIEERTFLLSFPIIKMTFLSRTGDQKNESKEESSNSSMVRTEREREKKIMK